MLVLVCLSQTTQLVAKCDIIDQSVSALLHSRRVVQSVVRFFFRELISPGHQVMSDSGKILQRERKRLVIIVFYTICLSTLKFSQLQIFFAYMYCLIILMSGILFLYQCITRSIDILSVDNLKTNMTSISLLSYEPLSALSIYT